MRPAKIIEMSRSLAAAAGCHAQPAQPPRPPFDTETVLGAHGAGSYPVLVTLHNNTEGDYSAVSYLPGGSREGDAAAVQEGGQRCLTRSGRHTPGNVRPTRGTVVIPVGMTAIPRVWPS